MSLASLPRIKILGYSQVVAANRNDGLRNIMKHCMQETTENHEVSRCKVSLVAQNGGLK